MDTINELYKVILERKDSSEIGSYTKYLFDSGINKILKKVGEESTEVIISAKGNDRSEQVNEICDLTYHLLVLMAELEIPLDEITTELDKRREKINNKKNERKNIENL